MPNKYSIVGTATSYSGAKDQMWQIKTGTGTPLWIDYISIHGQSDTADSMEVKLARVSAAASSMTSYTPLLLEETATADKVATAAGGTGATAVYVSSQTDGTVGDILGWWSVSTQSGGGLDLWFPPMQIIVKAGGGLIGLFVTNAITSTSLTFVVHFTEIA